MRGITKRLGALETKAVVTVKGFRFVLVQYRDGKPWRKSRPHLPDQLSGKSDDELEWMSPDAENPNEPGFHDVMCNGFDIRNRINPHWM